MDIQIENWGVDVPIHEAIERQTDYWAEKIYNDVSDKIIFVEHLPVYTAGAALTYGFKPEKIAEHFKCPLHELRCPIEYTRRGGLVTYQGPGILSVYFIFGMKNYSISEFENALLSSAEAALKKFGIQTSRSCKNPGLYVGNDKKIVSFGIQISRGVTKFGMAISIEPDMSYLDPMIPCGLKNIKLTSLAIELGREINVSEKTAIKGILSEQLVKQLN